MTKLTDIWSRDARLIEIGVERGDFASQLIEQGATGYLGVARSEASRAAIVRRFPQLAPWLVASPNPRIVRQNNAEVLVLNGRSILGLWRFRNVRHARHVAVRWKLSLGCLLAVVLGFVQWILRNTSFPRIAWLQAQDAAPQRSGRQKSMALLLISSRRAPSKGGTRRFVPYELGVGRFLQQLQQAEIRHAALRWFETLPEVQPGEDIDLLVADEDIPTVWRQLDSGPGIQPIDLYSAGGLPGSDFCKMPYYPPNLAEELLDRAVDHRGVCHVPSPREHFLSLAYHALYHKGYASGLPLRVGGEPAHARPEHDYQAILTELAARIGIEIPITLPDLDAYLEAEGWRPPYDMLSRLEKRNVWVRSLLERPASGAVDDSIGVFILREVAMQRGGLPRTCQFLQEHGFQIVDQRAFDLPRAAVVARAVRGANWERGPWPMSGGLPVAAVVTYDPDPTVPTRKQKRHHPFLANGRLRCKVELRDLFNADFPREAHCNVIHSSDNGHEASEYLRAIAPDENDLVYRRIAEICQPCEHAILKPAASSDGEPRRRAA